MVSRLDFFHKKPMFLTGLHEHSGFGLQEEPVLGKNQ